MSKDFIGFTFNGVSSEELGIMRVSDGDRYDETLSPEINDRTSEVPGRDGQYYFGTDYGAKPISVSFAYDDLTEKQLREIRRVFSPKKQGRLIFDESPYKAYLAKVENPIEMNYICFDEHKRHIGEIIKGGGIRYVEKDGQRVREDIIPWVYEYDEHGAPVMERIYKGEGTIEFICYYPFAKSVHKLLNEYSDENVDEWKGASGLLTQDEYETEGYDSYVDGTVKLYNAGDMGTGLKIYCPFENHTYSDLTITYKIDNIVELSLSLKDVEAKHLNDVGFLINTETQLIQGVSNYISEDKYTLNNTLYNNFIKAGSFFKIAPGESSLEIEGGNSDMKFFYDYLYL